jgi:hypothetical protein
MPAWTVPVGEWLLMISWVYLAGRLYRRSRALTAANETIDLLMVENGILRDALIKARQRHGRTRAAG